VEATAPDPIVTEVIRQSLLSAAEQMKIALRRTAFSPIVYDMLDFCCCLYDRDMRLLAQAKAMPIFLGTMNACVESCVHATGGLQALEPGDVLFSTYAYDIGSHPQDAAVIVPFFAGTELVGFAAVKAHHMDIGAKEPFITDSVDNFQEGTIFPGVKVYRAGVRQDDIYRVMLANSRLPAALAGDLNAQIVAAEVGIRAVLRVIERYRLTEFRAAVERMLDHGEATMRRFLAGVPDGRYTAAGALDSDGISDDPVPFEIGVEFGGGEVVVDFTNCAGEQRGPINCPLPATVSAARLAIVGLSGLGESVNEGHFRAIGVRTRERTLFHPLPPAPIYCNIWPAMQAVDLIHRAMAGALPEAARAGSGGDCIGFVWWGTDAEGRFWAAGTDHVIGQGATADGDGGAPLTHISEACTRNTPVETLELRHPVLTEQLELATDSGGAGRFAGGPGIDVRYRMLTPATFTSPIERTRTAPWGLAGGGDARPNGLRVELPDGSVRELRKTTAFELPAGAVVHFSVGGGGGYGSPGERDPRTIWADVRDGYVSERRARIDYPHAFADGGPADSSDPASTHG
jgi:N-methylhydantoinase B